ncbi:MAG TPA: hypothetical protein VM573_08800 [Actinomycetota bacterium]|jgi:hypothetical protein|nr:hypothetical protein [Actinomycetota bacterium]
MDTTFITGMAAFISSVIVFCGSVWLLLAVVMGSRLAYFVTATVTLAFTLMMGLVWSFTPLGPLGELPSFQPEAIGASPSELDFGQASAYPEGEWRVPDAEDETESQHVSDLESSAGDYLEQAIEEGEVTTFESAGDAQVVADSARLIEIGGTEYGAVLMQPAPDEGAEAETASVGDPNTVLVVMEFDPGNPQGLARTITIGTLLLFLLHMFGLSRAERRARELREQYA